MAAPPTPLWQPLSAFLAHAIVRLWPSETKHWGLAFEAELPEIKSAFAALRWLIGGVMLLGRESLRSFLKSLSRPLGVPARNTSSTVSGASGPTPRLPRLFAMVFLTAALAVLSLPEVRASLMGSVLFDYVGFREYFRERSFQDLLQKAHSNHDPQLLAFLSLVSWYNGQGRQLADEAIRLEPSLTWIDYAQSYWNYADRDRSHFLSDQRIARLQKFDPQNAATLLLTAEVIRHPVEQAYWYRTQGRDSYLGHVPGWEREIAHNTAWLAAMDRAFAAPRFQDYASLQIDLIRQVSDRYHVSDRRLIAYTLFAFRLPDDGDIVAYSRFLLDSGDKAAQEGNSTKAAVNYQAVEQFAERIWGGGKNESSSWLATELGSKAAQKLKGLFETTGHGVEARGAAAKFAAWDEADARMRSTAQQNPVALASKPWSRTQWAGLLINLTVLLIAVFFPLVILALLCVTLTPSLTSRKLGRFYKLVCVAADVAPALLLLSFAALFFVFHPYANPFQNAATPEDIFAAASVAHTLPRSVEFYVQKTNLYGLYWFWTALTAALSVLAILLLYRMFARRFRHT